MTAEPQQVKIEIHSFEDIMTHLRARDEGVVEWTQHTTENGTHYAVGVRVGEADPENAAEPGSVEGGSVEGDSVEGGAVGEALEGGPPITNARPPPMRCVDVDWVPGDEKWKETKKEVKDLGISKYRFYTHWYQPWYELNFHNTRG